MGALIAAVFPPLSSSHLIWRLGAYSKFLVWVEAVANYGLSRRRCLVATAMLIAAVELQLEPSLSRSADSTGPGHVDCEAAQKPFCESSRLEIKLQPELDIARVHRASDGSKVTRASG